MRKERKYRGFWDNGHDEGEFEYYSSYRNYSKKNMEDMKQEYFKKHGYNHCKNYKFEFGYLTPGHLRQLKYLFGC